MSVFSFLIMLAWVAYLNIDRLGWAVAQVWAGCALGWEGVVQQHSALVKLTTQRLGCSVWPPAVLGAWHWTATGACYCGALWC
jgi:hypothetical protein